MIEPYRIVLTSLCVLVIATGSLSAQQSAGGGLDEEKFENPLGWTWDAPPRSTDRLSVERPMAWLREDLTITLVKTADGDLYAVLSRTGPMYDPAGGTEYRVVAYDNQGRRSLFRQAGSSSDAKMTVSLHRLARQDAEIDSITQVGVEALHRDGRRLVSKQAVAQAKSQGIDILPLPELDQTYNFELTDVNGNRIRSGDLRGNVVVIDFWATWCQPCMAKMPALKKVYQKWHDEGLEVIGVSYDRDLETAKKTFAEKDLRWTLVYVPQDETTSRLWDVATGIRAIPRLLVIDRDGILRANFYPFDLENQLRQFMEPKGGSPTG